jgi:hypothetical protein
LTTNTGESRVHFGLLAVILILIVLFAAFVLYVLERAFGISNGTQSCITSRSSVKKKVYH